MVIPEQPGDNESLIVDSEANRGAGPVGKLLEVEHAIPQARPQAERTENGHEDRGQTVTQEPIPSESLHSAPSSSSAAPVQNSPILIQQISTENPISRPAHIIQPTPTSWVNSLTERLIARVTETHSNALNFTLFSEDLGNIDIRAPRFFLVFRRSGPIWRPEACGKRLAGVFGSVVGTHSARLWRASASSA